MCDEALPRRLLHIQINVSTVPKHTSGSRELSEDACCDHAAPEGSATRRAAAAAPTVTAECTIERVDATPVRCISQNVAVSKAEPAKLKGRASEAHLPAAAFIDEAFLLMS